MGIILFIRRIVSIYAIINKPTSGFVAETEPVSYTHLDVYKRQVIRSGASGSVYHQVTYGPPSAYAIIQ